MFPQIRPMSVMAHYDRHLADFYSWMIGDFATAQSSQQTFLLHHGVTPNSSKVAIDLGAGHGLQSVSLAKIGFDVVAVDFNHQLLQELRERSVNLTVKIVENDILEFLENTDLHAEVVVCMGDTLTHLTSYDDVEKLIILTAERLTSGGKLVLSFRDLTNELKGDQRFISVRSDENKMLTCFLEYFSEHVMVHDILHTKKDNRWEQSISSYPKLRIDEATVTTLLKKNGFRISSTEVINRMIYIIAEKL
jgi:2-polyprenyl-3-methyl-5-hydroxy-6-metoxy-1,4-benzoquinol methylase